MLTERKKNLLSSIINQYIKTAEPVGSNLLVGKFRLGLSPATVRNEMVVLEKEGYIFQPHTSAGRVPTEKGYRFYINNFLEEKTLTRKEKKILEITAKKAIKIKLSVIKELAKALADLSSETIIVGFGPRDVYYTGLANLFSKPEFSKPEIIYNLSKIIDHLDDVMYSIFNEIDKKIKIMIGEENPFSGNCSTIISQFRLSRQQVGILGILGPMRMDYETNIALFKQVQKLATGSGR